MIVRTMRLMGRSQSTRSRARTPRLARALGAIVFASLTTIGALGIGSLASAQTKPKPPAAKPKPPAPKADASVPAPSNTTEETTSEAGAPSAAASDAPVPAPPQENADGGRASPLTPQPPELPSNAVDAGAPVDYDRILAEIAALRARVAAVADNLYQSRIAVSLQTDGDHAKIARLAVSLDDGVVYTAPTAFAASDLTTVYDHAVAPGRHAVTIDVDRKDDRDEGFRTSQRSRFTVEVPRDNRLEVQVKILDDSSMGGDFGADKSGKYDLRFRVKAVAKPAGK